MEYNLSFSGCGFLSVYHIGVCYCLRQFSPQLIDDKVVSGCSAGATAASMLLCNVDMNDCLAVLHEFNEAAHGYSLGPFDPRFNLARRLREGIDRLLPPNAHVLCSSRLHISMTRYPTYRNLIINDFKDREELINALLCSSFIPIVNGIIPPKFREQFVIDGGFTQNLIRLNSATITVSPFYAYSDIGPQRDNDDDRFHISGHCSDDLINSTPQRHRNYINTANAKRLLNVLWPIQPKMAQTMVRQGFSDTLRFLINNGLVACPIHAKQVDTMRIRLSTNQDLPHSTTELNLGQLTTTGHGYYYRPHCEKCQACLKHAITASLPPALLRLVRPRSSRAHLLSLAFNCGQLVYKYMPSLYLTWPCNFFSSRLNNESRLVVVIDFVVSL